MVAIEWGRKWGRESDVGGRQIYVRHLSGGRAFYKEKGESE